MENKIAVLIVTFNRLDKLKKAIQAYEKQSYKPYLIYIVDNCSSDGTKDYLKVWKDVASNIRKEVLFLDSNIGGSGGFYEGMKAVRISDFDWLWISDDDAYPNQDAFAVLNNTIDISKNYGAICSSVYTHEGIDIAHRKVPSDTVLGICADEEFYKKDSFDISIFSFVGSCIKKEVLETCGLPQREFFIWFDDTEYSLRVTERYKALCVPAIKVFHDTIIEKEWRYSWKTYYGERNKLKTMQLHLSKVAFRKYILKYKLGMCKHYFTDYDYYISQKSGYDDFKKNIFGLSPEHKLGVKPKMKKH